jgi:class 3 adenylate cyclase
MHFCGMCGSPLTVGSGRERRRVTVVFIDLASFTSLTYHLDPEALRDLVDEALTLVAGIIEDYDGHVNTFRGDGLVAVFGAPTSHPDDPQRAVLAAAAGLKAIAEIGQSKGIALKGRAGVNTGTVIAGSVGSGRVKEYTVMGSAVNLAARLEAAATVGEVWVGPETFEATRHALRYLATPPLTLRGFPDITQAYRLDQGEAQPLDPFMHLEFVGRNQEMNALLSALGEVVTTRTVQELWLTGEAGIGKSRLIREFDCHARVYYRLRSLYLVERHDQGGVGRTWSQLAQQLFALTPGEELRLQQHKLTLALEELLHTPAPAVEPLVQSLSVAADAPRTERRRRQSLQWQGYERRSHLAEPWADLLASLTDPAVAREPVQALLLVIENNLHDQEAAQLVRALRERPGAVLILRTTRRPRRSAGGRELSLPALSLEESLTLLRQLAQPFLEVATQALVVQTGGIPAYLLELGRALGNTPTGSFSGSLTALLQARLDMLPGPVRQLLAHSALIGERCWDGLLRHLAPEGADEALSRLQAEHLLLQETASRIPGQLELRFQSELLRDAALRLVPLSDYPTLHLRIAQWLERNAPIELSRQIARHFEAAGNSEAAYSYYLAATELALAEENHPRALELAAHLATRELPLESRAEALLTYAQAALAAGDAALAERQLAQAAQQLAESSPSEHSAHLSTRLRQLAEQVAATATRHL